LIESAAESREDPVIAWEYIRAIKTASEPLVLRAEDRALYAVKLVTNAYGDGHALFLEQVVARLGALLGAPVPPVTTIAVDAELAEVIDATVAGNPVPAGIHHGSLWCDGYSNRRGLWHEAENRSGFGALCVLYTWMHCVEDHQFVYRDRRPHLVLSVDHSAFFAQGGQWSVNTLAAMPMIMEYDPYFVPAGLLDDDLGPVLDRLERVTVEDIAQVVAAPPDEWKVSMRERVALAEVIYQRQDDLLALARRWRTA
jgi:hypothetical protein